MRERCCRSTQPGQKPPSLQQVSSRIEEILLQQRVNQVFDNWLANLRKQGQIEVLDPVYRNGKARTAIREQLKNERDSPSSARGS